MNGCPEFAEFFRALWGYGPFPWQSMLAERVAGGEWPKALDLPTAAGKTACIEIALYALAAQAGRSTADRTAPRRIWFVVDRRIVVDQAHERAAAIACRLRTAAAGPLGEVARRLREVSGTDRPLAVGRLRGGVFRDDGWARLPSQPAVITSTVDQLGSRLLFRGYGHSLLAAPIFAGLAANDSLILLDEAHCSVPFLQTLQAVETYRGPAWAESPVPTPFAFVILSATPPRDVRPDAVFPGSERERALNHPVLDRRLRASKRAALVEVAAKKGASGDPLPREAAGRAVAFVREGRQRVAVMVNRVNTAVAIAAALREMTDLGADVVLLTGRLRPFERDRLVERWSRYLRAQLPEDPPRPIVLVSTQCLEVGADFSFEALVTEAASLDALRQRFGRLDRMGTAGDAPAVILVRATDTDPEKAEPDRIYGRALAATWKLLKETAVDDVADFGVEPLRKTLDAVKDLSPYLAPAADAPVLLPAHLDLLCQTAPAPAPEPDVSLFLHGKDRSAPEVQVVWRGDLPERGADPWLETVALCPPVSGEMLTVPLYRLRAFLAETLPAEDSGDVEGVSEGSEEGPAQGRRFLLWRGRERSNVCRDPRAIIPGDVVVLPASYGLSGLGQPAVEEGAGEEGLDLWERALEPAGKAVAVRLHQALVALWSKYPPLSELLALAEEPDAERDVVFDAVDALLAYQPEDEEAPPAPPGWWLDLLKAARGGRVEAHPARGLVLFAPPPRRQAEETDLFADSPAAGVTSRSGPRRQAEETDLFADDDDLTSASGRKVSLEEHSDLVNRTVEKITRLCLPEEYVPTLGQAGSWHDAGKLDERFQILLHGGDELAAFSAAAPLAKSGRIATSPAQRRSVREASGLPANFRHELLSVQIAHRHAPRPDGRSRDLLLHLIASHHGHARPFAPACVDPETPAVSGQRQGTAITLSAEERRSVPPHRLDSGIADRFWRLARRHGWWGLAYLEAILRLSDWYASGWTLDPDPDGSGE